MYKLTVTKSLSTTLTVEKTGQVAGEAGVELTHVETKLVGKGKWLNDFEVSGPPGRVANFFERMEDLRRD